MTELDRLFDHVDEQSTAGVIGAVAAAIARQRHLDAEQLIDPVLADAADDIEVPGDIEPTVDLLGLLLEHGQSRSERRRRGSHFTPADVAGRIVDLVRDGAAPPDDRVCDPTAGGGAFLLAAARALEATGVDRAAIVTDRLWGADIDPLAVAVTRTTLALWGGRPVPDDRVVVADTLGDAPPWPVGFGMVVGNPPFLSPLARATAPDAARRAILKDRFGSAYGPYVDAAALFLLVGLDLAAPAGRMGLVQPLSLLAARDAAEVRRRVLDRAALRALWVATDRVFDAAVEVCAPVVELGASSSSTELFRDRTVTPMGRVPTAAAPTWATMAAPVVGIPAVEVPDGPQLGDQVEVVAGFRDEYYAMAAAVGEGGHGPRVVTAGRVGPLRLDPDGRPVRIQRSDYVDPRIDLDQLRRASPKVAAWLERLLVPKLLLATQTPVIEVVVDPDGTLAPLTPVIAVIPPPDQVWIVAALLSAPSISAVAATRTLGLARHHRVIKLAAREVRALPGVAHVDRWRTPAELVRATHSASGDSRWRASLVATAQAADAAFGAGGHEATVWWADRLGFENARAGLHAGR